MAARTSPNKGKSREEGFLFPGEKSGFLISSNFLETKAGEKSEEMAGNAPVKKGDSDAGSEENEEEFEINKDIGDTLNLSKKKMKQFPENLLERVRNVQYLYLEGNKLTELPENFFENLPRLKWLDLRNNNLGALPSAGLKNHGCLEVILLYGNRIRSLPVELATVGSLKGLQIAGNPITNVPYDEIAKGFKGIMNYLQKLYAQDELLLHVSESVVVKPSTSQDEQSSKTVETNDAEFRMWDLEKLSRWRQFMKKKSTELDSEWKYYVRKTDADKINSHQPKISVSVRSHPKIPTRAPPFRCGVFNKNRHRITTSALHYRRLRKTRLGYKRKPITMAMIQEKARKEAHREQMREMLEKQANKIQRMKNKEVLKSWQDHARHTKQQMKLLDNYQQYPSKDFADKTPFDVDPEFLNMLNRVDLYRSLKDYDNRSKRIRKPKMKITALDMERQMNEIMKKLQQLDTNDEDENKSPRTKQSHMCNKMQKIMVIQKTLRNLQSLNSSMSGVIPIIKPKPKPIK